MAGPLTGVRVVEVAGIGPGPFCAMLLSDMGAEVLRIDRKGTIGASPNEVTARGRASLALDLKAPEDRDVAAQAIDRADVLIEGFRPGVMERLGLGPSVLLERNPRLIYGRMTGWGQEGPLAQAAGHDLGYIAVAGALDLIGPANSPPVPPLNLVGDFGGGALYLAFGIVAALYERERSGCGQVIDAAIVDGVSNMMALFHWLKADGISGVRRGEGLLDGSAPFYRAYACSDGRYVAVAALEPQFYAALLETLGLSPAALGHQYDRSAWPRIEAALSEAFAARTRDEWNAVFLNVDACVTPVLGFEEAPAHPHMSARMTHVERDGLLQPSPAPRLSRTPGEIKGPPPRSGDGGLEMLDRWLSS
jgi:alpha-methylacyl-CoA racemase